MFFKEDKAWLQSQICTTQKRGCLWFSQLDKSISIQFGEFLVVLTVFQYARMEREFIGATQFNAVFSLERGKERGRKGQQYFD